MLMPDFLAAAWDIDETDFPRYGLPSARLAFLLRYAVLAPSTHNTQPWIFQVRGDRVSILFDRTRALPVVDPHDRLATMSCGAALFNLRLAIRHFGYNCEVQILPDPHHPDLLATVRLGGDAHPTEDEERLFAAITRRHTNRKPYSDRPVPRNVILALESEAEEEGAWLHIVEDWSQREALASLVSEGDRVQWGDEQFRLELAGWIRPNVGEVHDGVPGRSMGYNPVMSAVAPAIIRTFDRGGGVAAHDRDLVEGSPLMAVVGTHGDSTYSWVEAGQAVQAVLLRATAEGLSASFLNQPVELSYLRERLAFAIGRRDYPQMVMRLGYGPSVLPSPRRLPGEVMR
ncbi:MAG TPA: nitroreductase family protein [Chloroflexia bacterium]|nr:nitroreductase family protein [Chloroflexia bacterium]